MRLPNPFTAYQRWAWRRQCRQMGQDVEFAEKLNEVGRAASAAGVEMLDHFIELALEGYRGESFLMELRWRCADTSPS